MRGGLRNTKKKRGRNGRVGGAASTYVPSPIEILKSNLRTIYTQYENNGAAKVNNKNVNIIVFLFLNHQDDLKGKKVNGEQINTFREVLASKRTLSEEQATVNNAGNNLSVQEGYEISIKKGSSIFQWMKTDSNRLLLLDRFIENIRIRALMLETISYIIKNDDKNTETIDNAIETNLTQITSTIGMDVSKDFFAEMLICFIKRHLGFLFVGNTRDTKQRDITFWNDLVARSNPKLNFKKKQLVLTHSELPDSIVLKNNTYENNLFNLNKYFKKHHETIVRLLEISNPQILDISYIKRAKQTALYSVFGLVDVTKSIGRILNTTETNTQKKIQDWQVWEDFITVKNDNDPENNVSLRFTINCNILVQGLLAAYIDAIHDFVSDRVGRAVKTPRSSDVTAKPVSTPQGDVKDKKKENSTRLKKLLDDIKKVLVNILSSDKEKNKKEIEYINDFKKMVENNHSISSQILQSGISAYREHMADSLGILENIDYANNDETENKHANNDETKDTRDDGGENVFMIYQNQDREKGRSFAPMKEYARLYERVDLPCLIGGADDIGVIDTANNKSAINTTYSLADNPIRFIDGGSGGVVDTPTTDSGFNELVKSTMKKADMTIQLGIPIPDEYNRIIEPILKLNSITKEWHLILPSPSSFTSLKNLNTGIKKFKDILDNELDEVVEIETTTGTNSKNKNVDINIGNVGMSIAFVQRLVYWYDDNRLFFLKTLTDHLFHTTASVNQIVSRYVLYDTLRKPTKDNYSLLNSTSILSYVFSIDFGACGGMPTHNNIQDDIDSSTLSGQNLELFNIYNPLEYPVLAGIWAKNIELKYPTQTGYEEEGDEEEIKITERKNKTQGIRVIGKEFDYLASLPHIVYNIELFKGSIKNAIKNKLKIIIENGEVSNVYSELMKGITCVLTESHKITLYFDRLFLYEIDGYLGMDGYIKNEEKISISDVLYSRIDMYIENKFYHDTFLTKNLKIQQSDYVTLKSFLLEYGVVSSLHIESDSTSTVQLLGGNNVLRHLILCIRTWCNKIYPTILQPDDNLHDPSVTSGRGRKRKAEDDASVKHTITRM